MFMAQILNQTESKKVLIVGELLAALKCQREGFDGLQGLSVETKAIYQQYCLDSNLFFDGE